MSPLPTAEWLCWVWSSRTWGCHDEESVEDGSEDDEDDEDGYDNDSDPDSALDFDDAEDGVNELEILLSDERVDVLEQTSDIHDAVTKVSVFLLFSY